MRRSFLASLFLLALIGWWFSPSPLSAQDEELDEEVKSTISSDPEMRGKKPVSPPSPSAPAAPAAPASPGEPSDDIEEKEWKTMRSETGRRTSAPAVRIDEANK